MPDEKPRELFLIDGNSLVYRAFFALPESIATSRGFPTNAIFGFASMLVKILTEYGPKPTLVVWDAGMSGRLETYEDYKAGRRERPDLLKEQWPHFHPLVDAFGYTNVRVEGYEADDVIATLARQAHEEDIDVMIVTGDRDLFQLIEDGVRVMATSRGITDTKIYDRDAVVDRYGIPPELVPDFVGLKGDTSDNIPGVPGIGEKTASQLLQEWGDLEGVLANIDSISGAKRKENLREHAENARISKELATSQREVEGVDVDLAACIAREPDRSRLREVFREFELRAPLERLEEALDEDEAVPVERRDEVVSVQAREVAVAELGALEGELVAVAALRPGESVDEPAPGPDPEEELELAEDEAAAEVLGEDEPVPETGARGPGPGHARLRRGDARPAVRGRVRGRRGAGGGGRDAGRVHARPRRPPRGGARLEDAGDGRRAVRGAAARSRHDGGRLPDRPGAARLSPGRAGRGRGSGRGRDGRRTGRPSAPCSPACWPSASCERLEEDGLTRLLREIELPLVDVLVEMERGRREAGRAAPAGDRQALRRAGGEPRAARVGPRRARSSRSARPSSSRRSCSRSWASRASAAARRASPRTPACSTRSGTSTRSCPRSRSGARSRS